MRIRFRGLQFGQVAKVNIIRANRNRLLVRRWCSGHLVFCSCDSAVRFLDPEIQANVEYCYVRRCAECTSLDPGLKHPSLSSYSSMVANRRAEVLHLTFFSAKHPSPARWAAALCILSYKVYVATKDARWVHCSSCSLGPSPRRPTASCSLAVRRGDCVRASWLYSWSNASIATRILCAPCTAAIPGRLYSVIFLLG